MGEAQRTTYVLVDGENVDATLGTSILGRRPRPEERPRWERVLDFARQHWGQSARGLFFLAANNELPMAFVQALLAIGYRPVALSGAVGEKVVDIAIQRTLAELGRRDADVLLVSNDGDFVEGVGELLDGRRAGVVGFVEFRNVGFLALAEQGLEFFDLEYDVQAFNDRLPRVASSPSTSSTRPSSFSPGVGRGPVVRRRNRSNVLASRRDPRHAESSEARSPSVAEPP